MKEKIKIEIEIKDKDIKIRQPGFRPGHIHKDKTKYTRKQKHKEKWNGQK